MEDNLRFVSSDMLCRELEEFFSSLDYDSLFVLTDENTLRLCFDRLRDCVPFSLCRLITIKAGDRNKTLDALANIWSNLSERGATRKSLLVNIGGGMVTDIGGFAASTFKRGIRYINIPTTLLSMVDASTGGKTGINFSGLKNEIGAFARPLLTLVSPLFLSTLPKKEFYSGYGEMIKHGLLSSMENWAELITIDEPCLCKDGFLPLIEKSVKVKLAVTEQDPYEKGLRKSLNFGHTVGHAFESLAMKRGEDIPHGYAVAWGLVCELYLSSVYKGFNVDVLRQTASYIKDHYGTSHLECKDYDMIYELMLHDKKNTRNGVNFTLLSDFGSPELDNYISYENIKEAFDFYREGL